MEQWRINSRSANNTMLVIREGGKDEVHCKMRRQLKTLHWRGLLMELAVLLSILG